MLKKLNKKGFTLAELLVVVAIIGVLVAVSIPIFTAQLRKARVATDLANERAAKAAAVAAVLEDEADSTTKATSHTYVYDAKSGVVVAESSASTIEGYGKVSDAKTEDGFADSTTTDHTKKVVKVTIGTDNKVSITWVSGKTATTTTTASGS